MSLPASAAGDDQFGVPMLGGADGDGVHVAVLEQFAVIAEGLHGYGFVAADFFA